MVWRSYSQRTVRSGAATIWTACVCLALVALSQDAAAEQYTGRVVGISDADTITVLDDQNRQHKIHLLYIDAPEKRQPYGKRSRQSLADLVFGKEVYVREVGLDRYGRTIGHVIHEGLNTNTEQVCRGMAWVYDRYVKDRSLYDIQAEARATQRGLSANPTPTPPWEWRKTER